jgi:hypothetical protein
MLVLVVVTTFPEMLSVEGISVEVLPLVEVTTTARIVLFGPVITRVTVPTCVPLLLLTTRPVVRPGSVLLATAPRARTLFGLAWAIPVGEAWDGPWLCVVACELPLTVPVVVVVGVVIGAVVVCIVLPAGLDNTLFSLACEMPVGDAFIGPWLTEPAGDPPAPGGPPVPPPPRCPCAKAGAATAIDVPATAAINELRNIVHSIFENSCGQ